MRRMAALTIALAALSGCSSLRQPMTSFALDYNRMIADSRNAMILLNIVRASNREPLHFTAISTVEATLTVGGSLGGSATLGTRGVADSYGASVNLSGQYAPTFTVVPLNTSEFAHGILRPITPEVIRLFRSQGWRDEMLAPLMISKIECGARTVGNGADKASLAAFSALRFAEAPPEPPRAAGARPGRSGDAIFDPPLSGRFVLPVDGAAAAGLLAQNLDQSFTITQSGLAGGKALLDFARSAEGQLTVHLSRPIADACGVDAQTLVGGLGVARPTVARLAGSVAGPGVPITVYLRSTEGIVYYLGELARWHVDTTIALRRDEGNPAYAAASARLFNLADGRGPTDLVHVEHRGRFYAVRPDPAIAQLSATSDRSIQVIDLIDQLIALQTTPDAVKRGASTVRVR